MRRTSRGRYCDACAKQVYDLSKLTEAEATALLDSEEDTCVSYKFDDQGNAIFRPPTALVPVSRLRRPTSLAPAALAPAAAGLALALAACAPHGQPEQLTLEQDTPTEQLPAPVQIPDADEPCFQPPVVEDESESDADIAPAPVTQPPYRVVGRLPRKQRKLARSRIVGGGL